jgi:hypothetical protein
MVATASSKILLVFRCGHEYVFTHGQIQMLTVTLSTTAITLFDRHNVKADDLAKEAAEWALLNNRMSGIVDLSAESDLSDFCRYYFRNATAVKRAC